MRGCWCPAFLGHTQRQFRTFETTADVDVHATTETTTTMTESQGTDNAWEAYQQDAAEAAASLAAVAGGAAAASGEQPESDFNSEGGSDGEVPPTPATKPAPAPSKRKQGRPRKHPPPKTPKMSHDEKWQERIEGLRAFKEWHGHTNVSRAQDKELGRFVNSQREYYKKLLEGKSSSLTPERIADLEDVSFHLFICIT